MVASVDADKLARAPCPVCTASSFRDAFEEIGHRYERCASCGFLRMADAPATPDLDDYYRAEREHGEGAWQEHEVNLIKFARMISHLEERVLPGRFLDVGCSLGTSLVAARDRGWEAIGIELSQPVAEFGRAKWGIDIRERPLEELEGEPGFEHGSFDVVFMHHTLEHVPDPAGIVESSYRLLRDGGLMFQALPNHGGLKSKLLGGRWSYGVTSEHVSLFSKRTLRRLVERVGFEVVEVATPDSKNDPRLLHDVMHRLGQRARLARWTGRADGQFDLERYVRYITDRRVPHFVANRVWPARLTQMLGLGQEVHMVAIKRAT